MYMDDGEIIREYNQAKDKKKQIQILADLNNVHRKDMQMFLREAGVVCV